MPIDYRIPAEIGAIRSRMIDPMTLANLREQVDARRERQDLLQQKYQADQQEVQQQNMLRQALSRTVTPEGRIDQNALGQYLQGGGDPRDVVAYRQAIVGPQETARWTTPKVVRDVVRNGVSGQVIMTPEGETFEPYPQEKPKENAPTAPPKPPKPPKPPSDTQQKYSFFAARGEKALGELKSLLKKGYRPSANAVKYLGLNPSDYSAQALRTTLSDDDIQFVSVAPRALTSILRPESGAVIGPDELGGYLQSYIPMAGQGIEKLSGLESELEGLRAMSKGGLVPSALPGEITAEGSMINGRPVRATTSGKQPIRPPLSAFGGK